MERYLQTHMDSRYRSEGRDLPGLRIFQNRYGWTDCYLGRHLIVSHRKTVYDMAVFPEKFHSHDFFEMDIFVGGCISYIADNHEIHPEQGDILLFPPDVQHTARQSEKSEFERIVFYFDPRAFDVLGGNCLPPLFLEGQVNCLRIEPAQQCEFAYLLEKLKYTLHQEEPEIGLLAFSYVIQLFSLIGRHTVSNRNRFSMLPQNILQVKTYIDENFSTINTAAEVAGHFFYSREYVSRLFKQYFNTNISEYLVRKKIDCAKRLLEEDRSITYAFNASGYRSMSSFVSTFRAHTSMTPSAYRAQHCAGKTCKKNG